MIEHDQHVGQTVLAARFGHLASLGSASKVLKGSSTPGRGARQVMDAEVKRLILAVGRVHTTETGMWRAEATVRSSIGAGIVMVGDRYQRHNPASPRSDGFPG